MYLVNPYYLEALKEENRETKGRITLNDMTIENDYIKNIKYDINLNDGEKFSLGGVHSATVTLNLLNYDGKFNNVKFETKDFFIELSIAMEELYTVGKINSELVKIINTLKIKHLTSLWVPQGLFYPTGITKNENKTITIKLIDKTKYLEDEYVCNLTPPFTLKQLYDDVHNQFQIVSDTTTFYNQEEIINETPVGYTGKQILGYIAECACGFYIINRLGNGEIRTYSLETIKSIEKGKYKKFLPAENYITIQKIKYAGSNVIGAEKGYVLEIDEKNPFVTDMLAQNILLKMQGFTFIPYTYQATESDFAIDVGDMFDITDTNAIKFQTYVMGNSWEFKGSVTQNWSAKGENELNNTYSSKGPITQEIENIVKEQIPNAKQEAIDKATELITQFNGGYVVKKNGELFISDNEDIDKAQHIWRWNINGLGYSSTGIDGPYGLAITMDGKIVADFITTGTMSAERINGGILKLGGNNNINGEIQVVDSSGNDLVKISKEGLILSNGTKLIGGNGVLSNFTYNTGEWQEVGFTEPYNGEVFKLGLRISAYIPKDFEIITAFINLYHAPRYLTSIGYDENSPDSWCNSRKVKLYKTPDINNFYIKGAYASEGNAEETTYDEIYNAFGENGFTGDIPDKIPNSENTELTNTVSKCESIDIKDELVSGKYNYFKIESDDDIPTSLVESVEKTGLMMATLNIIGYMK